MIYYKKRRKYKYNLRETYNYRAAIDVEKEYDAGLLKITSDGHLTIEKGYSWDGPSGPTFDTKNFMRPSLVHDALYQLMREENISQSQRKRADEILREICLDCGMWKVRAWYVYCVVRLFGARSAKPDLRTAP